MTAPLNLGTVALLTAAPLLWAGNAIVGRLIYELISPFTLNFMPPLISSMRNTSWKLP